MGYRQFVQNQLSSRRRKASKISTRKRKRPDGSSSLILVKKEPVTTPVSEEVDEKLSSRGVGKIAAAVESHIDDSDSDRSEESDIDYESIRFTPVARSRPITEKERARYTRMRRKSGGFDVPVLPGVFFHGMLFPSIVNHEVEMQAKIAVKTYNQRMRKDLQLVRVLRAVTGVSSCTPYYITLEAKDGKGEVRTYQTHAIRYYNSRKQRRTTQVRKFFMARARAPDPSKRRCTSRNRVFRGLGVFD
ncbi:hypothetical protein MLD38_016218 [Melastoma candidum]|uniref:Uncharacterized protein n=1 Tax=Melastoma candidum TaxID=119954 RepID=A0ACB9RS66_9MYRT|nr:hypothetical protein MLD38_016218 [Melastoma candidum]